MKYISKYETLTYDDHIDEWNRILAEEKKTKLLARRIDYRLKKFFGKNNIRVFSYFADEIRIEILFNTYELENEELLQKYFIFSDEIESLTKKTWNMYDDIKLNLDKANELLLKCKKLEEIFDEWLMNQNVKKYNI